MSRISFVLQRLPMLLALALLLPAFGSAQQLSGWGDNLHHELDLPDAIEGHVISFSLGINHALALTDDGSVAAWGLNDHGQCTIPAAAQSDVVAVDACGDFSLALKSSGSVVAWGDNTFGQCNVPAAAQSSVVSIAAGAGTSYAVKSDGTVVAWGYNPDGRADVSGLTNIVAISATNQPVALKADGSVAAWQGGLSAPTSASSGVVAVSAGNFHYLALKSDGSVVAWGSNTWGETNVPVDAQSGVVAISAGNSFSLALKSDGSLLAWGADDHGQTEIPPNAMSHVTAISARQWHALALRDEWIQCDPSLVWAGNSSVGSIHLKDPAPPGGLIIQLTSDDPHVRVPSAISLTAGQRVARFHIASDLLFRPLHTSFIHFTEGAKEVGGALQIQSHQVSADFSQESITAGSTQKAQLVIRLDVALPVDAKFAISGSTGLNAPTTATIPAGQTAVVMDFLPSATIPTGAATASISFRGDPVTTASLGIASLQPDFVFGSSVVAGSDFTAKVVLDQTNRIAVRVTLSSTDSSVTFPPSVKILAGAKEAAFTIHVAPDATTHSAPIVVTLNGISKQRLLNIIQNDVADLTLSPSTVQGGMTSTGTVTLKGVSSADTVVNLTSSATVVAQVPATVTVPKGSLTATFSITTNSVTATKTSKIKAVVHVGVTRTLTVTP